MAVRRFIEHDTVGGTYTLTDSGRATLAMILTRSGFKVVAPKRFHFTPTGSSWLNQIETWFSILQGQSLNGTSFTAVEQLQEHIDAFIAAYNETAEPFAWTRKKVYQRRFKNRRITQL